MPILFEKGKKYSREDIYDILSVPPEQRGGHWDTGYALYKDVFYLFVNVEAEGRTGHNYNNHWLDDGSLFWYSKTNHNLYTPTIQKLIAKDAVIHVFTRNDNREQFTYRGLGKLKTLSNEQPVQITWSIV